jgi:hypothetical protein
MFLKRRILKRFIVRKTTQAVESSSTVLVTAAATALTYKVLSMIAKKTSRPKKLRSLYE